MPETNDQPIDTAAPAAPAPAPAPGLRGPHGELPEPPAPPAPPAERLSPGKWAERLWSQEERKTRAWLLNMVVFRWQRAAAEKGEDPVDLTQVEFEEALAAAAGHQVVQDPKPKDKE